MAPHGFFLIVDRLFLLKFIDRRGKFFGWLYTFIVVVLAWVPFRVEGIQNSMLYFKQMFAFNFTSLQFARENEVYTILIIGFIVSIITLTKTGKKLQALIYETELKGKSHVLYFSVSLILFILCVATLAGSGFSPFIYFRF